MFEEIQDDTIDSHGATRRSSKIKTNIVHILLAHAHGLNLPLQRYVYDSVVDPFVYIPLSNADINFANTLQFIALEKGHVPDC